MIPKISLEGARNMHNELRLFCRICGKIEAWKRGVLFKTGPGHVKDVERKSFSDDKRLRNVKNEQIWKTKQ